MIQGAMSWCFNSLYNQFQIKRNFKIIVLWHRKNRQTGDRTKPENKRRCFRLTKVKTLTIFCTMCSCLQSQCNPECFACRVHFRNLTLFRVLTNVTYITSCISLHMLSSCPKLPEIMSVYWQVAFKEMNSLKTKITGTQSILGEQSAVEKAETIEL